jgi:hypothetical protein
LRRNHNVFGGSLSTPAEVIHQAKEQLTAYDRAEEGRRKGLFTQQTGRDATWQKPPESFYKLNWDASIDVARKQMGIGVAVRDHKGMLLASLCATKEQITDPGTAEAIAAWHAAKLAQRLGLRRIVLEGNA